MFHQYDRRHMVSSDPTQTIRALERLVDRLSWNKTFGCFTREALDAILEETLLDGKAAVFWDIDGLGAANKRWGKAGSSTRIRHSISVRSTDCLAGQVFSGDEFIAFPSVEDAIAMAERIQQRLHTQDMSATFYITLPYPGESPDDLLQRVDSGCAFFKNAGHRNQIHLGYGMEEP